MTVGSHSYGNASMVAGLAPRYADNGAFTSSTRPTLVQVEIWIDQTSGTVNVLLAEAGFTIPITVTDGVNMLAGLVCAAVADRAEYANKSGRFWTETAVDRGISIEKALRLEISDWINAHAKGLENLGASRASETGGQISFRDGDQAGDPVVPLFERKAFGDHTTEWDG